MKEFFVKKIIQAGEDTTLSLFERRRVRILNIVNTICWFMSVAFLISNVWVGEMVPFYINLFNILFVFGLVPFLHHKKLFRFARYYASICLFFAVLISSLNAALEMRHSNTEIIFMGLAAFSIIEFENIEKLGMYLIVTVTYFSVLTFKFLTIDYIDLGNFVFQLLNSLATFIAIYAFTNAFKHEFQHSVKVLENQKDEIAKQSTKLKHINETKDKVFSVISHDLKTPVNQLQGLLNLLQRGAMTPEEFQRLSKDMNNNVQALSYTLDNLLTWSMTQINEAPVNPISFKLEEDIQQVVPLYQKAIEAKRQNQ